MSTTETPVVLFDTITIVALSSLVALVVAGISFANVTLPANFSSAKRFLFIWHAADALCHLIIEGSFVYHCLFSYLIVKDGQDVSGLYPTPDNFLYSTDRIYGPQAGGSNIFAQMWMVYARADRRWAGVDIVSSFLFRSTSSSCSLFQPCSRFQDNLSNVCGRICLTCLGCLYIGSTDGSGRYPSGSPCVLLSCKGRLPGKPVDDRPCNR
jgi:hypothetical protein